MQHVCMYVCLHKAVHTSTQITLDIHTMNQAVLIANVCYFKPCVLCIVQILAHTCPFNILHSPSLAF